MSTIKIVYWCCWIVCGWNISCRRHYPMWVLRGSFFAGPGGQISFYATRGTAEVGANMPRSLMCIPWIRHVLIRFSQAHFSDFRRCIYQIIEVYHFTRPDGLRRREPMCPVLRSGGGLQLQQYHSFICFAPSTTTKFDPKLSDTQFRINFFWRSKTYLEEKELLNGR